MIRKLVPLFLTLSLLLGILAVPAQAARTAEVTVVGTCCYQDVRTIFDSVNAHRAANGRSELTLCPELTHSAMLRAAEISYFYSHTRPDGSGFSSQASQVCGENIAYGQDSAAEVMEDWKNSPGHNENILSDNATRMGVGVFASDGVIFWVQTFGYGEARTGEIPSSAHRYTVSFQALSDTLRPTLNQTTFGMEAGTTARLPRPVNESGDGYLAAPLIPDQVISSDPSVAQVSRQDINYDVTALAEGSCQIIYTVGDKTILLPLTVSEHCITLSASELSIMESDYKLISATTIPEGLPVTWESSNPDVAKAYGGAIHTYKEGTAVITAAAQSGGTTYTAQCTVTVTPNLVGTIELEYDSVELKVGETFRIGMETNPSSTVVTWENSDTSVVQLRTGKDGAAVYGLAPGTVTLTAKSFSHTATCQVTVYPKEEKPATGTPESNDENSTAINLPAVSPLPAEGVAYARTQDVDLDGRTVELQAYAIKEGAGETNFVKLRDVAKLLNGTPARFRVNYDSAAGTIAITTGRSYTANGSEGFTPFSGDRVYRSSASKLVIDGQEVALTAFVLTDDAGGGYTYFKLRDLGAALGFNVDWSAQRGVFIESDKPYSGS